MPWDHILTFWPSFGNGNWNGSSECCRAGRYEKRICHHQKTKRGQGNRPRNLKADDGTTITDEKRKLERWKEHFEKILNEFEPTTFADIPETEEDLEIYMGNIKVGEVKEAIQKLKCGEAPGDYGVCPEMLKVETEETPVILRDIPQNI
ncbi:hypothetical protein ElyMa_000188300 [Elysia marginata]|uniref:Reverse transcriptase domain-containing protein n=1 Tax=Elysia marginata TaxID=1093978 RepID=A0AAV4EXH0_9GAST|nr:hypothetical protein ElyMa_000188300 [Elysia marginata]